MEAIIREVARHLPAGGESRRLFHGRGQCFAGFDDLIVDCYPPLLLVILYRPRPAEWLAELTDRLLALLPQETKGVLLQERFLPKSPSRLLWGELPEVVEACEDGLRYRLRPGQAQNVGFFPDMAVGRRLLRRLADGGKVLNLFAYTCSFSVAALAGGAAQVVNLDMNRGALDLGRLNHTLNGCDLRRVSFLPLELFRSFGRLKRCGPFDLVICDPPASQGQSFSAERHWPKLIRRLPELLAAGGQVLACRSTPAFTNSDLQQMFGELLPTVQLLARHQAGDDFPEVDTDRGTTVLHYALGGVAESRS